MATRVDREGWDLRLRALGLKGKLPGALTQRVVEAAQSKPLGARYMLADGEVPGLALHVYPNGAASYVLQYRTIAGLPRRHGLGTASAIKLEDVRKRALELRTGVMRGGDPIQERRTARVEAERAKSNTLRAYLEQVYAVKVLKHRKDGGVPKAPRAGEEPKPSGTYARILSAWKALLPVELGSISRDALEKVLADRKDAGTQAGTLLRDWSALRALLADAVDRGHLAAVPVTRRPEPIRKLRGNQRVRYFGQRDTAEDRAEKNGEAERFGKALATFESNEAGGGDFLRCVARLALATGMRRGEIVRLTGNMLNERERRITLPPEITKSNKSRVIHLRDDALAALEIRKKLKLRSLTGELFPGEPARWEDRITQREWPRLCAQAKLEDFHFHDLRHDFAVRLLRSCGSLAKVRDALGHASVAQTEKYAHVAESEVREAVLGMLVS